MIYKEGDKLKINGEELIFRNRTTDFYFVLNRHIEENVDKFFEKCGTTRDYIGEKFEGKISKIFPEIPINKLEEFIKFLQRNEEPNYEIY